MDRVHQGLAGSIFMIEPVKIGAADLEGRNPSGRVLDPDAAQIAAFTEEESTDEDVRGLVILGDRSSPPLQKKLSQIIGYHIPNTRPVSTAITTRG